MSETTPTVKVKADNEQGYVVINAEDMTEAHTLFDDAPKTAPAKLAKQKPAQ